MLRERERERERETERDRDRETEREKEQQFHVAPAMSAMYVQTHCKKRVTHIQSNVSVASLLESRD